MSIPSTSKWRPNAGTNSSIFADVNDSAWWSIERIWSSAGTLDSAPIEPNVYRIFFCVEGAAVVKTPSREFVLDNHKIVVLNSHEPLSTTSTAPWARYEIRLASPKLAAPRFRNLLGRPLEISESYWQIVVSTINAMVIVEQPSTGAGTLALRGALEQLVLATLTSVQPKKTAVRGTHLQSLYNSAMNLIDQHFQEPDFSVSALAEKLAVSPTHLHRVFAPTGISPRKEIENARVLAADDALATARPSALTDIEAVARSCGFTTARQMRRAMQRWH